MKFEFHVHTQYSKDSILPIPLLKKLSQKKGITPIITDHDTIEGNLKYKCKVIGEEIYTQQGEIIGLFMMEGIPRGLPLPEVLDKLKEQDALVCLPHPFDITRRSTLIQEEVKKVKADIIEVFNARILMNKYNKIALQYATDRGLPKIVGSDSHTRFEIGNTYMIMDDFYSKKEFLRNLKEAKTSTSRPFPLVHALTLATKRLKAVNLL